MMFVDRGLNARWKKPDAVLQKTPDSYEILIKEPFGKSWKREIVSYPFEGNAVSVSLEGKPVLFQTSAGRLSILVEDLKPNEERIYQVQVSPGKAVPKAQGGVQVVVEEGFVVADSGLVALKFPASRKIESGDGGSVPGPIAGIRAGGGAWFGKGGLRTSQIPSSIKTSVVEEGPLWTAIKVSYNFKKLGRYSLSAKLFPRENFCEIREESSLPVDLWPQPRPYREIGTLGSSHWSRYKDQMADPCVRPFPSSLFTFDLSVGMNPDRIQTHSTASWEIMDIPLARRKLKAYTVMRASNPFMDAGWMGFYSSRSDIMLGVASKDLAGWRMPDDLVHPVHRTPGASSEVIFLTDEKNLSELRFPIENIGRTWILSVTGKKDFPAFFPEIKEGAAANLPVESSHPVWALRNRLGDMRLDKVKDWITDWRDEEHAHPSVLCRKSDFAKIREKLKLVPEFAECYRNTKDAHSSDRYIMDGEKSGLDSIENATNAKALVERVLALGYTGPSYAIGLARPLRRYALACDIEWDTFSPEEKKEARRICALAAYVLSDGDYWQYAWRPDETTYLPNFNTDVFTCYGLIGLFLSDHPCSKVWSGGMIERLEMDLAHCLHDDGCGDENLGSYNISTWTQLWLPAFWGLKHCGIKDYSGDPRILAGARFFLDILGPPDPRDRNCIRMVPPIGHHPHVKKTAQVCAWLAAFVNDVDPELASNLMWFWNQTGRPISANGDHSGPKADPHTFHYIFSNPWIRPLPYEQRSKLLPRVGAVLHSHTDSGKGSFLLLKSGPVHSHHDADEGAIHYVGRGVPLANDGLPLVNINYEQSAELHNVISFDKPGQPTGSVEKFFSSDACDYVRAVVAPRAYACDAMFMDGSHESGFIREIMMVKSAVPGGVEYIVLKDRVLGPDMCQWNIDVLSRKPEVLGGGRVWFPGHEREGFGMGLDLVMFQPEKPEFRIEEGILGDDHKGDNLSKPKCPDLEWLVVEHWNIHVPAAPGTTFLALLFPRRRQEKAPVVQYYGREEVISVRHGEGSDLIFLRSNPLPLHFDRFVFQGAAGLVSERNGRSVLSKADAKCLKTKSWNREVVELK